MSLALAHLDYFSHLQRGPVTCSACDQLVSYAQPGATIVLRAPEQPLEFADYLCRQCRSLDQSVLLQDLVNLQARKGQGLEEKFRSALQHFLLKEAHHEIPGP